MKTDFKSYFIPDPSDSLIYKAPHTHYCKTKTEFDEAVGSDFITHANKNTEKGAHFLVGLSHGQSVSGPYEYILKHYTEIKRPELLHYTFINSKLKRQRGLVDVRDAISFIKELLNSNKISKDQIIGRSLDRDHIESYKDGLNLSLSSFLEKIDKQGLDYVFIASTPEGQVAGITRNSKAFESNEMVTLVKDNGELELTVTPYFLMKSARIAFLATKAEKRRPLAWLFYKWGKPYESPSFLRFIDNVETRMTVFIDDKALTWPQIKVARKTNYGETNIRVDMALPYNKNQKTKLPVVLMIHGFLGLNTFDGLLAFISSKKYISAAMHYGSIPDGLPIEEYSQFVVENIDAVVEHFGSMGHPVYLFDHSIANTYGLMIDQDFDNLHGIKTFLRGRIASNPFFGEESKHSSIGFMDNVILKSNISILDRVAFQTARLMLPFESNYGVRRIGIGLSKWLIKIDAVAHDRVWKAIKERILTMVTDMDTLPELNKVPIAHTLHRLPIKIFAIQINSALKESRKFDKQTSLSGFEKYQIPVLILKSDRDPVAKFVPRIYGISSNIQIIETTNPQENDTFKEHLFYMIHPQTTINIIDHFIKETEEKWAERSSIAIESICK